MNKEDLLDYFKTESLKQQKIIKFNDEQLDDIFLYFGNISNFYEKLFFNFTKEELIGLIKNKKIELGRLPLESEIGLPIKIFENIFGSWKLALKEALRNKNIKFNDEFLLNLLNEIYEQTGKIPSSKDLENYNKNVSYYDYIVTFGGWKNALLLAGIKLPKHGAELPKYFLTSEDFKFINNKDFKAKTEDDYIIYTYEKVLSGQYKKYPHLFWEEEDIMKKPKIIMDHLLKNILKWNDYDIYNCLTLPIIKQYRLESMYKYVFNNDFNKLKTKLYPDIFL